MKHHRKTHILTNTEVKQSKRLNGTLKLEQLKTTNRTMMGPNYLHDLIIYYDLGPVVQSVVSLTSSLRVILLTVLADLIHNILIFFAEKI